ncbi:phage tail protein [Vibrio fluvialis]|uniref:phage tail-collar fiber domain-containing protein n=1 Tax=Vibrio fluvialis TaxID=676 RepID=UPI0023A9387D|nr:phage tail protein [Vibrio fluvialis]MDE5179949.1 phage tail protein [Vibrio fluvialis]
MIYSTIPTQVGAAKLRNASLLGQTVNITRIAFGDGNGAEYEPTGQETELKNQVYECPPNRIEEEPTAPSWIELEAVIPSNVGGWYLREVGCYDDAGDLIFIGNLPSSFKPSGEAGVIKDLVFEMVYDAVAADVVAIKINPNVVIATRKYVDDELQKHVDSDDPHEQYLKSTSHLDVSKNPHPQYALGTELATVSQKLSALTPNTFIKAETSAPAFMVSGGQLKTATALTISVGGVTVTHAANEVISTPVLLVGVDYAIYATADGLVVSNNFTVPDGYTAENSRRVGGFHYGNNEFKDYSFYDLHFRPACKDPRGMVIDISGSRFWNDIYLLNSTPDALGTSAYNAQIADSSSPCKIPALWGGDGTVQYPNLTQYIATEVLAAYGKRLPSNDEFEILALGSTPGYAVGADPVTTKFDVNARSKNGSEQVSGHLWQWGKGVWERGDGSSGYDWYAADTNGEGMVYSADPQSIGAVLLGANWGESGHAGARASLWAFETWSMGSDVGARGLCDHLLHV